MLSLTHIVPRLPPAVGGVGDYCVKLWDYWLEPQPHWCFLITADAAESQAQWLEVKIAEFEKSTTGLICALEALNVQTAVLHYSGYGYHPKGCPLWLPQALGRWKAVNSQRRVVVMFHELYATGSIWSSNFWVKPFAQKIIRDLISLSDLWVTSCSRYQTELVHRFAANPKQGALIPIGSNILPNQPVNFDRPWSLATAKKLKVVIFGLARTRLWTLNVHAKLLKQLCDRNLVESITLAGNSELDAKGTREMAQHRAYIGHNHLWQEAFDLTPDQISQLLVTQDLGLVCNEPDILTKSSVFAVLSAHGVLSTICGQIEKLDDLDQSVFLYNSSSNGILKCSEQMQSEQEVDLKKQALKKLMRSLDWKQIALAWFKHLEQIDKL